MSMSALASLSSLKQVRIVLINAGRDDDFSWVNLRHPLRLAQGFCARCQLQCLSLNQIQMSNELVDALPMLGTESGADIVLLVADDNVEPATWKPVWVQCQASPVWGAVGAPVLWLARSGLLAGVRVALPWALFGDADAVAESAILTSNLYEIDHSRDQQRNQQRITCAGGAASLDFALSLIEILFGKTVQAQVQEVLCVDRVRAGNERQRIALQARFGNLQPKLSEAVTLMESNLEEPLSTDEIAALVGLSRRQLERLFKQYLDNLPSRYYLELRLKRARQLLLDSHHSIVQVGLMCGFSSGSHFSTAFGLLFGITPREERQRRMQNGTNPPVSGEK
jgi:transcriptional regulator GlxA family with amidase domain